MAGSATEEASSSEEDAPPTVRKEDVRIWLSAVAMTGELVVRAARRLLAPLEVVRTLMACLTSARPLMASSVWSTKLDSPGVMVSAWASASLMAPSCESLMRPESFATFAWTVASEMVLSLAVALAT